MEKEEIKTTSQLLDKEKTLFELKLIEKYMDNLIQSDCVPWETALYANLRIAWVAISNAVAHIDEYGKLYDEDLNEN